MKYINKQIVSVCVAIVLLASACGDKGYKVSNTATNYIVIDSLVGENSAFESVIEPYRDSLQAEMNKIIGVAAQELDGGFPEGLLSNFVTDLVRIECSKIASLDEVDVSVVNVRGLRIPLQQGHVTVGNIYQLMPFENEIVCLTLSKEQMEELFNFMASIGGDGISGASFGIKEKQAVNIKVNHQPLEDRNYVVATSDYLADGGDHFTIFKRALKRESTGLKVRDAIMQHIMTLTNEGKEINSKLDKRIYHAE